MNGMVWSAQAPRSDKKSVNLRYIDWIWNVRGSVPLAVGQSSDDAFDRLDPLFREFGTTHDRTDDTLTFQKKDQAAQDKMSVFDHGVLHIDRDGAAPVLRYRLTSRILLFCFLAPLMFIGIAQFTIYLGQFEKPSTEAADKLKKAAAKKPPMELNPIDKFLGAPEPEKPGKDGKEKTGRRDKKPSPTPAYVFASLFAILYGVGRVLEDRLVKSLFRKRLLGL